MNFRYVLRNLGTLMYFEAICLGLPLLLAFYYQETKEIYSFLLTMFILAITGRLFRSITAESNELFVRDGFATVAIGWILVSIFGAFPFVFSETIPTFVDALFESISGFSTTGSSVISDVEAIPKSMILWRSLMQWLGGVGILYLMVALIPNIKGSTLHILKAEIPGPTTEKFVPKLRQVTKITLLIYTGLTFIQFILLLIGDMSIFDALVHAFSTGGTGGFSSRNESIAAFNSVYIEVVITIFMFLFGVNFTLYNFILRKDIKSFFRDEEFRFYLMMMVSATILIVINLKPDIFTNFLEAFRYSAFQVVSLGTSTGFMTYDYNDWPLFSHMVLFLLMFIGASAGSSSGGFTVVRILLLMKIIKRSVLKLIHPSSVQVVKINNKAISEEIISNVMMFFFIYIAIFFFATLLIAIDGKDLITSTTAVLSAISNTGPGLAEVGPTGNFADFSSFSKMVLSLCMLLGRLEIYPILLVLSPVFWKK